MAAVSVAVRDDCALNHPNDHVNVVSSRALASDNDFLHAALESACRYRTYVLKYR